MTLATEPKYFRSSVLRASTSTPSVDRSGGYAGAGVIRNVSFITQGEALGHDVWIDSEFTAAVANAVNANAKGVKVRFTHPSLSGDGFGKFLGRAMDARVEGDQVVGDIHFSKAAHDSPDGDLASYVMTLAENEPEMFGMSIAFSPDWDAMEEFAQQHTVDQDFQTPDASNEKNLLHVRLGELRAVDAVDEPAANPNGLFHGKQNAAAEADAVLSYALGLSDEKPETQMFSVDADRVKGFVARFCEAHKITFSKEPEMGLIKLSTATEEPEVAIENKAPVEQDSKPEIHTVVDTTTADAEGDETPEPVAELAEQQLSEGERFLEAFGDIGGVWFAKGMKFSEAQNLFIKTLREENEKLSKQLAAAKVAGEGESEPVEFSEPAKPKQKIVRLASK